MKEQKGITLIALIITIIVMLILVGVSVTVALNGGLFTTAQNAAQGTKVELEKERLLSIVLGTLNDKGIVDSDKLEEALEGTEFTLNADGTITSEKTKNIYTVSERGSVTLQPKGESVTGTEYTIGTEVTIGETGENFYVIKDEGENLVLLAKYNIKKEGTNWIQDTSGASNECEMSTNSNLTFTAGEDLNEKLKNDTTSAVYKASQYAENTIENGAAGRLMTYGEAEPLSESEDDEILEILYGTYTDEAYLNYWLGSADTTYDINAWAADGGGGSLYCNAFDDDCSYGVRPIIEISESAVTIVP